VYLAIVAFQKGGKLDVAAPIGDELAVSLTNLSLADDCACMTGLDFIYTVPVV